MTDTSHDLTHKSANEWLRCLERFPSPSKTMSQQVNKSTTQSQFDYQKSGKKKFVRCQIIFFLDRSFSLLCFWLISWKPNILLVMITINKSRKPPNRAKLSHDFSGHLLLDGGFGFLVGPSLLWFFVGLEWNVGSNLLGCMVLLSCSFVAAELL